MVAAVGELAYDGVGKRFPSMPCMRSSLVLSHGECGIEQKHTLLCPSAQTSQAGDGAPCIVVDLLEDVDKRGRHAYTIFHRETKSLGLSWTMIRILSDDDHLDVVERTEVEGIKYLAPRRVASALRIFRAHERGKPLEVGRSKLLLQHFGPRRMYFNFHRYRQIYDLLRIVRNLTQ